MLDILLQCLAFAVIGPILGGIVGLSIIIIASYLAPLDNGLATGLAVAGFSFGAAIGIAGVSKAVFLFVKVVF